MFDLERFRKSLAETVAYCAPIFTMDDPKYSLRTLLPLEAEALFDHDLVLLVDPVIQLRSAILKVIGTPIPSPPTGLQNGRLLLFEPNHSVTEGTSNLYTFDFLDYSDSPPCDTWVYSHVNRDKEEHILMSWIPGPMIKYVQGAIDSNSTQCIRWLYDYLDKHPFLLPLKNEYST